MVIVPRTVKCFNLPAALIFRSVLFFGMPLWLPQTPVSPNAAQSCVCGTSIGGVGFSLRFYPSPIRAVLHTGERSTCSGDWRISIPWRPPQRNGLEDRESVMMASFCLV